MSSDSKAKGPIIKPCLHLVLGHRSYDETVAGTKRIEYREMKHHWMKLIYNRRSILTHVKFVRGYSSTITTYEITKINIGPCPIEGWDGDYIRIHFN